MNPSSWPNYLQKTLKDAVFAPDDSFLVVRKVRTFRVDMYLGCLIEVHIKCHKSCIPILFKNRNVLVQCFDVFGLVTAMGLQPFRRLPLCARFCELITGTCATRMLQSWVALEY